MENLLLLIIILTVIQGCASKVLVGVTIHSYSNPNGTTFVKTSSNKKCCDGPERADCATGDTCDTFFDICVGRMESGWGCRGAFFLTLPLYNTNTITNIAMMESVSEFWTPGMAIFVFVRDDDSQGAVKEFDHIDTVISELNFNPSPNLESSLEHIYAWGGDTTLISLNLSVRAWCYDNYYSDDCSVYCKGIEPSAVCDPTTGELRCWYSDAVLIEFRKVTNQTDYPALKYGLNSFMEEQVCRSDSSQVDLASLSTDSNTLTFAAFCGQHILTPMEFESFLRLVPESTLVHYFSPGIVQGGEVSTMGYGEHITPNVLVSVEVLDLHNPDGTSFDGDENNGTRRCCDAPQANNCNAVPDLCDMMVVICIGDMTNDRCIGSVTISSIYRDTAEIKTCGPVLVDVTNGHAYPSHPMIGGMRLVQNRTGINVIVKDIDNNGSSSDIIDVLQAAVTATPGPNATSSDSQDVLMKNFIELKLRLLFWCAPGHAGLLCLPMNGTDRCQTGWYGDRCEIALNACSPNPCKHDGKCTLYKGGTYNCTCDPGYTGTYCEQDVDECKLHICQNNATCQNFDGAFNCICQSEWTGLICTEDKVPSCIPSPCSQGTCVFDYLSEKNYICYCNPGWIGRNCNEKYVCSADNCFGGVCTTVNQTEQCFCDTGFVGDNCTTDIDECNSLPCPPGGTCTNTYGSFKCHCPAGYNGHVCDNLNDPCSGVQCKNNGTCVALNGSYKCACAAGYTGSMCQDIVNFCNDIHCEHDGICHTVFDDFLCNCSQNWSGKICGIDVNECAKSVCVNSAFCQNLPGSYNCTCYAGWTGKNCDIDIDECSLTNPCNHGNCINTPGSFRCNCFEGYMAPNCTNVSHHCTNISCSGNGQCLANMDGHICRCYLGYTGEQCENDIDECREGFCDSNNSLNCTNWMGRYQCSCKDGWQGKNCSHDIDECSDTKAKPCSGSGICTNFPGNYSCQCYHGFAGKNCATFINSCKNVTCKNNSTCSMKNFKSFCNCLSGWSGNSCDKDINECENYAPCQGFGICENTDGSFYCRCNSGRTGKTCRQDINECLSSVCRNNAVCTNTVGSYQCLCMTGFQGMSCEVKTHASLTGSVLGFFFQKELPRELIQPTISDIYVFLRNYICNRSSVDISFKIAQNNTIEFIAACSNMPITIELIAATLKGIPNNTRVTLFPLPLQEFHEIQRVPLTTRSSKEGISSQRWISSNWPLVSGCSGAAVLVTIMLVSGYFFHRRRNRQTENGFNNPSYSTNSSELHDYPKSLSSNALGLL